MPEIVMGTPPLQVESGNAALRPIGRFSREGRTLGVLIAIVVMAYADLDMTLAYATSVGMGEGNPVARAVMGIQSTTVVILYKILCTLTGISILYRWRQSLASEIGAWTVLIVMCWLMCRWSMYNTGMAETPGMYIDAAATHKVYSEAQAHPDWVVITP
jgi:hypothetical protein